MPDVNVLVYAHREDAPDHQRYLQWLTQRVDSDSDFALAGPVLSGFLRVATHPRGFNPPSTFAQATAFLDDLLGQANCIHVNPGRRHWQIFVRYCEAARATGNIVPDAYLAALATEIGAEWISTDRGFARFPGLRWRAPF